MDENSIRSCYTEFVWHYCRVCNGDLLQKIEKVDYLGEPGQPIVRTEICKGTYYCSQCGIAYEKPPQG